MKQLSYTIRTLSPVLMSSMSNSTIMTATHDDFSGSIIRGVLASRYVEKQNIKDNAYKDKNFLDLFYGGLKFLPANPDCNEKRSFILPLSLQQAKSGNQNLEIQDLLTCTEPSKGYKSLRGYGIVDNGKIKTSSVNKNIFMHMSRSSDNERLAGKSSEGQIYNYESINEGQFFHGLIIGDSELLQKLIDGLNLKNKSMNAYIGRSHFTQYGKCHIVFDELMDSPQFEVGKKIFLRLDTPLISSSDFFVNAKNILTAEIVEPLNDSFGEKLFSLDKIFSSGTEIENFIVPWGMKRPRVMALSAGSVFELKSRRKLNNEEIRQLNEKCFSGFGIRTEEGFGQLRIWEFGKFTKTISSEESYIVNKPDKFSTETVDIAKKILINHCLDQISIYAYEDAKTLEKQLKHVKNMAHFFSRLDNMIRSLDIAEDVQKALQKKLESEIRDGSLFEDHLKNLKMMKDHSIYDVLMGKTDLPYTKPQRDLQADLISNSDKFSKLLKELEIKDFDDFIKDTFFLEYMKNYFRFARKMAADVGGDD